MEQAKQELAPSRTATLIDGERKRLGYSIRHAAELANISEGRWRQIAKGYQQMAGGVRAPVNAPSETLARMAEAVKFTRESLVDALGPDESVDGLMSQVLDDMSRRARWAELSVVSGEPGTPDYFRDFESWVADLQERIESLEIEVEDLRSEGKKPGFPDYSQMSEEDVRNYGLAAKDGDKNIAPGYIPDEP
ncbi:hypothetical protein [Timonella senegalensis]|uniref:hypothetical protein n=1 Tax=Timonella senegalensis TaxID=1465825 RepID=UPI0028A81B0B|nr:hypothetical protein [Timonella senegalensis]